MDILFIESIGNINYYRDGSKLVNGKAELELIRTINPGKGNSISATFEYYGYDNGERFKINSGSFNKNESEMNDLYELIRSGVPSGTKSEMNLYENSVTAMHSAVDKFEELNPGLSISDFQIKP